MKAIITKLNEIKEKLVIPENNYSSIDKTLFNTLLDRITPLIIRQFGKDSPYLERLAQFNKETWYSIDRSNIQEMHGLIDIIIDEIELDEKKDEVVNKPILIEQNVKRVANEINTLNNKVFIVHGHNDTMKQSVARIVEKLQLDPIILHEQSNLGNTIIEKFMIHSNVGFAIVLLSADDYGYSKNEGKENAKKRARQNVILELGFFIGKLGRNRVVALVEDSSDFEIPSDINGVIYIPFDNAEKWKFDLLKELIDNGYKLDANKIL